MARVAVLAGVVLALVTAVPASADKIVFASDRDGSYDIWIMNPDGTGQVKLAGSPSADEFSPVVSTDGTKIAFIRGTGATSFEPEGDLMIMNADGTGEYTVTFGANDPSWSPSGTQLAFGSIGHSSRDGEVWKVNVNGSGATPLAAPARDNLGTSWSPDGSRIAFHAQIGDAVPQNEGIWSVKPDGTGLVQLTHTDESGDRDPDWSPNGSTIAFSRNAIWSMGADGSGPGRLTDGPDYDPAWSPNGQRIAFDRLWGDYEIYSVNPDGTEPTPLTDNAASDIDPDWLPEFAGYARPKGATPFRASLAIAYRQCTAANRMHGPPLAFQSCNPPQQTSDFLTVGTADADAKPALNEGYVKLDTIAGNPATPGDEADVKVEGFMDDVFTKAPLADYTGELRAHVTLRITDRDLSGASPNIGTTADAPFDFDMPCTAVADPQEGASCSVTTTFEALIPGAVKEGKRAIWAMSRVEIYDGGADGAGATTGDNTLFATQGLFIP